MEWGITSLNFKKEEWAEDYNANTNPKNHMRERYYSVDICCINKQVWSQHINTQEKENAGVWYAMLD